MLVPYTSATGNPKKGFKPTSEMGHGPVFNPEQHTVVETTHAIFISIDIMKRFLATLMLHFKKRLVEIGFDYINAAHGLGVEPNHFSKVAVVEG